MKNICGISFVLLFFAVILCIEEVNCGLGGVLGGVKGLTGGSGDEKKKALIKVDALKKNDQLAKLDVIPGVVDVQLGKTETPPPPLETEEGEEEEEIY